MVYKRSEKEIEMVPDNFFLPIISSFSINLQNYTFGKVTPV